jgi:hypothetical protein
MSAAASLVIEFTLIYDGRKLARNETSPHAMAWCSLPGRSKSYAPLFFQKDKDVWQSLPTQMCLVLPLNDLDKRPGGASYDAQRRIYTMPVDTTIGVQARCCTKNTEKRVTIRGCGESLFPVGIELSNRKGDNVALRKAEFPLDLVYHTHKHKDGSPYVKGQVTMIDLHAYLSNDRSAIVQLRTTEALDDFSYVSRNAQSFNSDVQAMMQRNIAFFVDDAVASGYDIRPSSDEVKRVHAPTDSLPPGPIPGFAFVMAPKDASVVPRQGTPEYDRVRAYLRELAIYALRRANMSSKAFVACVNEQLARDDNTYDNNFTECCAVAGQMLAIPSTASPYIGDFIIFNKDDDGSGRRHPTQRVIGDTISKLDSWQPPSKNGCIQFSPMLSASEHRARQAHMKKLYRSALIKADEAGEDPTKQQIAVESFNELADYASGDCEDLGCLSMRIANTWSRTEWDAASDPLVHAVGRLLRQYVFALTLGSVRSAALGNEKQTLHEEEAGEIDGATDRKQKYGAHMWCLGIPAVRFCALIARMVPDFQASSIWRQQPALVSAEWIKVLPVLNMEGTGYVTSLLQPAISYIVVGGANGESVELLKQAKLDEQDRTTRVYAYLESKTNSRFLGSLMTIKHQARTLNDKPNYRLTRFYRQITHLYTDWLQQFGYSNVDFLAGNIGQRVPPSPPSSNNLRFEETSAITSQWLRPIGGSGSVAANISARMPVATSVHHVSMSKTAERIGAVFHSISAGDSALHVRPASGGDAVFEYGTPLEDLLQTILLPATALLPTTPIDARDVRVIATLLRHAPPITMPGNWTEQEKMQEARIASRRENEHVDELAEEKDVDANLEAFDAALDRMTAQGKMEWPKTMATTDTLHLFLLPAEMLSGPNAVPNVMGDIEKHFRSGVVKSARCFMEQPMPHIRTIGILMICDSTKVPR